MHLHILGVCGTFMGSLAQLARELGHRVTGSDENVYPPMSDQLRQAGIEIREGYAAEHLEPAPDLVVVGNALSRGNPAVEYMLDADLAYRSGPQWLSEYVLRGRHVLAVSGTHGKTTTASMLAWILEDAGLEPGFLIGGVPGNFAVSARVGRAPFFVVEADEYDTAFFDKRSKFVHYRPRTAVLNNLEYDHADIFPDLAVIQRQFHHLLRIVPGTGQVILPDDEPSLDEVLAMGCWSGEQRFGEEADTGFRLLSEDGSAFEVLVDGEKAGEVHWALTGLHNVRNGVAALLAARHAGVALNDAIASLCNFGGVKRRMELLGDFHGVRLYDDFAHHPTAIATTLEGLRKRVGDERIVAVIEPRSNTMRMGEHRDRLPASVQCADAVLWYEPPELDNALEPVVANSTVPSWRLPDIDSIMEQVLAERSPVHVVLMSNGGFGGLHRKLQQALTERGALN
jgi:UDP-N-acetylmuramate: L-alanyl-gamma-D-glutamyl-meso-diaminopimelate ligase